MFDNYLTKEERRSLRKMEGLSSVPKSSIYNFDRLYELDLVVPNYSGERDPFNAPIKDGTFRLGETYYRYLESRRWFTSEYVVSHIIIPVGLSIAATLITLFLTGLISG